MQCQQKSNVNQKVMPIKKKCQQKVMSTKKECQPKSNVNQKVMSTKMKCQQKCNVMQYNAIQCNSMVITLK